MFIVALVGVNVKPVIAGPLVITTALDDAISVSEFSEPSSKSYTILSKTILEEPSPITLNLIFPTVPFCAIPTAVLKVIVTIPSLINPIATVCPGAISEFKLYPAPAINCWSSPLTTSGIASNLVSS